MTIAQTRNLQQRHHVRDISGIDLTAQIRRPHISNALKVLRRRTVVALALAID
jgi:predicted transcriptional regulator